MSGEGKITAIAADDFQFIRSSIRADDVNAVVWK